MGMLTMVDGTSVASAIAAVKHKAALGPCTKAKEENCCFVDGTDGWTMVGGKKSTPWNSAQLAKGEEENKVLGTRPRSETLYDYPLMMT